MFILDPEMMKKTFLMGENGTNFTHKSAQHIKLFPFTANNTATIITSFSAVIGEWLRLACNQNKVPESMEATLSKLADSMDDIGAYEKEQLLQIARSIYWDDDEKHSLIQTDRFKNAVVSSVDKAGAPDSERLGSILYDDIIKFLLPANGWADFVPLFGLSDDDEMRVQAVLNRVSQFEIKKIAGYRKRLDKSLKKSQEIREKLQNSSVENYQEYTDAISKITKEIYDLSLQSQSKQTELTACEEDIIAAEKELETAYKKLEMDIKRRSVSAISSKVLLLLEDLQVIIFDRLIREVREDTLTEFNRLIRKRKFIDDIQIDNEFRVHLLRKQIVEKKDLIKICRRSGIAGIQRSLRKYAFSQLSELIGNPDERNFGKELESCHLNEFELMMEIDKDTLSKGETQVFVMSLYWAMMQQCKCELPFIIDTPFARIDTDHRANIVEQFFKRLPGQLFVLSTNEEIGSKHMLALHDQTSNIFLLEYGDDKCTHIMNNQYFEV